MMASYLDDLESPQLSIGMVEPAPEYDPGFFSGLRFAGGIGGGTAPLIANKLDADKVRADELAKQPTRGEIAAAQAIDAKNRGLAGAIVGNSLAAAPQQAPQGLGGAPRQLSVPQLRGYGLEGMQRDIRDQRRQYGEGLEEYETRMGGALEQQLQGEEAAARAIQTQAERSTEALREAEQAAAEHQATVGEIQQRKRAEQEAWQGKISKAQQHAQYFDLEPGKVDELLEIQNAKDEAGRPLYSHEQRNAAAAQLKQAQEVSDKRSVGTKIGAAIAMALGAFGSALSGGPNVAMQIINKQIDDDIMRQKELRASKYGKLAETKTDFGRAMAIFKDEEQAAAASKLAQLERVVRRLDVLGAQAKGEQAQAGYQKMKGALEAQKAELGKTLLDHEQAINAQSRQQELGIVGQRMQRDQANMSLHNQALAAQARGAGGEGAGKPITAATVKEIGEYDAARKQLDEWYETTKKVGGSSTWAGSVAESVMSAVPWTDEAEAKPQKLAAAQAIGSILEGGKLTDTDFKKYMRMIPDVGDTKQMAKKKRDAIDKMLQLRQLGGLEALKKSGYNVDKMLADIYAGEKPGRPAP